MTEPAMNQASPRLGESPWDRTDAERLVEQARTAGAEAIERVRERGQQAAGAVEDAARQGSDRAAAATQELAEKLRERAAALPGQRTAELADQAVGSLERGAAFLRRATVAEPRRDLMHLIRHYPVQSLVVGLVLGFLLASAVRALRS